MGYVSYLPARKTIYKGIEMRSRTEALFAALLDKLEIPWEYEGAAFGGSDGQYLPDFHGTTTTFGPWKDRRWFIEVKPTTDMDVLQPRLDQMRSVWESVPDAVLALAVPSFGSTVVAMVKGGRATLAILWPAHGVVPVDFPVDDEWNPLEAVSSTLDWHLGHRGWGAPWLG